MKNLALAVSAALAAVILIAPASFAQEPSAQNYAPPSAPAQDARPDAARFLEEVNDARIALAMNNAAAASDHLTRARDLGNGIMANSANQSATQVETGRLSYGYDAEHRYHYFPLSSGPIEVTTVKSGPFWANKGLAVTDAEIVYLSLDLSGPNVQKRLAAAQADIAAGKNSAAGRELAVLTDEIVKIDDRVALPLDKARDNIRLARDFIGAGNYEGARYPLHNANMALGELAHDNQYQNRRPAIEAMRRDVADLEMSVKQNAPNALDKADAKLKQWWQDLKSWGNGTSHS